MSSPISPEKESQKGNSNAKEKKLGFIKTIGILHNINKLTKLDYQLKMNIKVCEMNEMWKH